MYATSCENVMLSSMNLNGVGKSTLNTNVVKSDAIVEGCDTCTLLNDSFHSQFALFGGKRPSSLPCTLKSPAIGV